jgi:phage protein D
MEKQPATPVFEVIDEEEAERRLMSARSTDLLTRYRSDIEAGLLAVQQGKRFHVRLPSPQAADLRALQGVIQRLARQESFHLEVRFDRATEGFIVRQATSQEQQRTAERRQTFTAAQEAQHHVAQSIMAQPDVSEDVETKARLDHTKAPAESNAQSSRVQQQTLSPGAEEGVYDAQQARETATADSQ